MKSDSVFASYAVPRLVGCLVLASSLSGCAAIGSLTNTIGSAAESVAGVFKGPEAEIARPVPAEHDLPGVNAVAVSAVIGKEGESEKLGKVLVDELKSSGRYRVVSGEALAALGSEASCDVGELDCLAKALPGSALLKAKVIDAAYTE